MLGQSSEIVAGSSVPVAKSDEVSPETLPHRINTLIDRLTSEILQAPCAENITIVELEFEL